MGRKSKAKDRGYMTATEWRTEGGGFKEASKTDYKRLPFYCCAISFLPFEDAACTPDGTVFDIVNIVSYIQKFKRHPTTGEPLALRDIITLNFAKNSEGRYHCPVLHKVFTESTHIVAVRPTGNVYCYEALQELNIKPRFWKDLLTDEPFTRKDIIHLQDPTLLDRHNIVAFDHVKRDLKLMSDEEKAAQEADPEYILRFRSDDAQRVLSSLAATTSGSALQAGGGGSKAQAQNLLAQARAAAKAAKAAGGTAHKAASEDVPAGDGSAGAPPSGPDPRLQAPKRKPVTAAFKPGTSTWNTDDPEQQPWLARAAKKQKRDGLDTVGAAPAPDAGPAPLPYSSSAKLVQRLQTTGAASRSFTSTAQDVVTKNHRVTERIERCPKKKAYLRLSTTHGDLNIELHSDLAPRAAENFLVLADKGYYTGTKFHRSIKNFMIQGGDPTGSGTGGQSIYGGHFRDECDNRLLHSGRGVLAMANSGPHTNGSQFYILYKSAHHLDYKHTVFGRVVGGLQTLTAMERVPVGEDDRPKEDIKITGCTVFVNPYKEEVEAEAKADAEAKAKAEQEANPPGPDDDVGTWFSNPSGRSAPSQQVRTGVGKYLPAALPGAAAISSVAAAKKEAAPAAAAAQPPGKQKPKQQPAMNFDAW